MSLNSETSRVQYVGNNSTSDAYTVPFVFLESSHLRVVVTDANDVDTVLALGTDYSVTGASDPNGGDVLTNTPYDNTDLVTIYRLVPATQTTVYEENADFPAKSHERALDKLTMLAQQILRTVAQTFRFRESDGPIDPMVAVGNSLIGLDANNDPRTMTAAQVAVWLNISQQFFGQGSVTFLNQADRDAATPQFLGQIGIQLDTLAIYAAHSLTVGDWGAPDVGIGTGSITTALLANGVLSADSAGRLKMADSFITLAKIGAGIFTADATGRGKFAGGFVDSSLLAAGAAEANMPAGTVLQTVFAKFTTLASITASFPLDDTIPQISEGSQVMTASITPRSASSKIRFVMILMGAATNFGYSHTGAAFRDAEVNALASATAIAPNGHPTPAVIQGEDSPATTSAVTYRLRAGTSAGTLYVNGFYTGTRAFGGATYCSILLQEIKA